MMTASMELLHLGIFIIGAAVLLLTMFIANCDEDENGNVEFG